MRGSGICWAICKPAPHPRQPRQHPTTQFFRGRMPFQPPNQQHQSIEGIAHNTKALQNSTKVRLKRGISNSECLEAALWLGHWDWGHIPAKQFSFRKLIQPAVTPEKRFVKQKLCVCACVHACVRACVFMYHWSSSAVNRSHQCKAVTLNYYTNDQTQLTISAIHQLGQHGLLIHIRCHFFHGDKHHKCNTKWLLQMWRFRTYTEETDLSRWL